MTDRDPNEWARLRRRVDALRDRIEPRTLYGVNPATRLGKVYNGGSMPGSLPGVFLLHPARPSGNEAEGATPGYDVDTSSSFAATVVGNLVPAAGDLLVARLCSGRWVAQKVGSSCSTKIYIQGCGAPGLFGASVAVKDASGTTTLLSGAADANGFFDCGSLPTGTYTVDVSASRFNSHTFSGVSLVCSTTGFFTTLNMAPYVDTSLYACAAFCAYPLRKTLYGTDSVLGSYTMIWTGSIWAAAPLSYSYPGCPGRSCAAATPALTWELPTSGFPRVTYTTQLTTDCPGPVANIKITVIASSRTAICPPSTFALSYTMTDPYLLCGATSTGVITE